MLFQCVDDASQRLVDINELFLSKRLRVYPPNRCAALGNDVKQVFPTAVKKT